MSPMFTNTLVVRSLRFLAVFASLRAIEVLTAIAALLVASAVHGPQADPSAWSLERELSGALLIARVYYLGFHYLLFSAVVFAAAEAAWGLNRLRVTRLANCGAFILHSLVVSFLVVRGNLEAFWGAWGAVLVINWLTPALLVRALGKAPAIG